MYALVCSWQRLPRAFCSTSTSASFLHFFCHTTSTAYIHCSNCISRTFHGLFRWITNPPPTKHIYIPSACTVALSIKPINVQPLWNPRTLWSLKTCSPFFFSATKQKENQGTSQTGHRGVDLLAVPLETEMRLFHVQQRWRRIHLKLAGRLGREGGFLRQ